MHYQTSLLLLAIAGVQAIGADLSPVEAIRLLTYQSRPMTTEYLMGLGGCGSGEEDRALQLALIRANQAAVLPLETAFDSLATLGEKSAYAPNAGLLVIAYAEILRRDAVPRLKGLSENPKLSFLLPELDRGSAIALSNITFLSASRLLVREFHCDRGPEPTDSVDRLILAWMKGSLADIQAVLAPNAKARLDRLLEATPWARFVDELWSSRPRGAVGYRLDARSGSIRLGIQFTTASGSDCGEPFRFDVVEADRDAPFRYLIDSADVSGLLRRIAVCATEPR